MWNVWSGAQERALEGHDGDVIVLDVCGSRLLSGLSDGSILVWGMGAGWGCNTRRTLVGHGLGVTALATWEGRAVRVG